MFKETPLDVAVPVETLQPLAREAPDALVPCTVGPRLRVLHGDSSTLWASRGLNLLRSNDGGDTYSSVARTEDGPTARLLARTPLASRALRAGFHGLAPLPAGGLVAIARKRLLHLAPGSDRLTETFAVPRGSRPLNVGVAASGRAYFGEYFGNPNRDEVHVYGTEDGRAWDVAWTFPAGSIRHVHGVIADEHRGGLWVLTGDLDRESAIWWTDDDFRTLEPVVRGDQRARAVQVIPTARGLIVPMDTPQEQNFIHLLDTTTGTLERVAALPGSAFTTGRARTDDRELYLVSTALEPSEVNTDPRVAVVASVDGETWRTVARFERDLRWLGDTKGRLGYPQVLFPSGVMGDVVRATGQSIETGAGRTLAWSTAAVADAVAS